MSLSREERNVVDLGRRMYAEKSSTRYGSSERKELTKRLEDYEDRVAAEYGVNSEVRKSLSSAIWSHRFN